MMLNNFKNFIFLSFLVNTGILYSQSGNVSTGGDAFGSGGSCSFSVGQIDYLSAGSSSGTVNQGIQQAYEIYATTAIENTNIQLFIQIYPNPSQDEIHLLIQATNEFPYSYRLNDLNGKNIKTATVLNEKTDVPIQELQVGLYFLTVLKNQEAIKTFKIIKN